MAHFYSAAGRRSRAVLWPSFALALIYLIGMTLYDAVPAYYVVNKTLDESHIAAVLKALQIHPVQCAVISSLDDAELALRLSAEVIRASSAEHACNIAMSVWNDVKRPSLVLGDAPVLDAIYPDGTREQVVHPC